MSAVHSGPPSGLAQHLDFHQSGSLRPESIGGTVRRAGSIVVPPLPIAGRPFGLTPVAVQPGLSSTPVTEQRPANAAPIVPSLPVVANARWPPADSAQAFRAQQGKQDLGYPRGRPQGLELDNPRLQEGIQAHSVMGYQTKGLATRRSASFAPRNEMEANAAREKEVLEDLFACALEDLRVAIPPHAKQRLVSHV
jgi:hypothetical protein